MLYIMSFITILHYIEPNDIKIDTLYIITQNYSIIYKLNN